MNMQFNWLSQPLRQRKESRLQLADDALSEMKVGLNWLSRGNVKGELDHYTKMRGSGNTPPLGLAKGSPLMKLILGTRPLGLFLTPLVKNLASRHEGHSA